MTVAELIDLLSKEQMDMKVVADRHSDYGEVVAVGKVRGTPGGGYVLRTRSSPFGSVDYVYLEVE